MYNCWETGILLEVLPANYLKRSVFSSSQFAPLAPSSGRRLFLNEILATSFSPYGGTRKGLPFFSPLRSQRLATNAQNSVAAVRGVHTKLLAV